MPTDPTDQSRHRASRFTDQPAAAGSASARDRLSAGQPGEPSEPGSPFIVDAPSLSLPTGGGAIRGIDEQFEVNPATGTFSLTYGLPLTPARGGFTPPIRLAYDSGTGNGVVGLGWSLAMGSIRRRTDRGVPRYTDEDVFQLGGSDDLVPALHWTGTEWEPESDGPGPLSVRRYRPRTEKDFARVERITSADGSTWWRVTSRDDVTTWFGLDEGSRVADPEQPGHVLQWLPRLSVDAVGNACVYDYTAENLAGYPNARQDANRRTGLSPFAQQHLTAVRYANSAPFRLDDAATGRQPTVPAGPFRLAVAFDYGQLDPDDPAPAATPGRAWATRPDPFSSYRGGFEVRTQRLLRRVLMFHQFDGLDGGQPTLVRSLELGYSNADDHSLLTSLTGRGHVRTAPGHYSSRALPPVEFEYEALTWNSTVRTVDAESSRNLPAGVVGAAQWFDLDQDGIAGVLTEQSGAWLFKPNRGDPDDTGQAHLGPQRAVAESPSPVGQPAGTAQLTRLDADGRLQLEVRSPGMHGYFALDDTGWAPFRPFPQQLHLDLDDPHTRRVDLVGDGRSDVLVVGVGEVCWARSLGTGGFASLERVFAATDDERSPAVVFTDEVQAVFLADLSGDGLSDLVRVRDGDISYWPNLGHGRFGARVAMADSPRLGAGFHPRDVRLTDLTGTGPADLVYLGGPVAVAHLNRSGNSWGPERLLGRIPSPRTVDVSPVDLLGNGTTALVWSSGLPADAGRPLRYVNPAGGRKPFLLRSVRNHLGAERTITYKPSTWFAVQDRAAGRPWLSALSFPVQCVRRVTTRDGVAGATRRRTFGYHHGYFDPAEREFRGFAVVEEIDAEDFDNFARTGDTLQDAPLPQAPVLSRTWFHTGWGHDQHELPDRLAPEQWSARLAADGLAVDGLAVEPAPSPIAVIAAAGSEPGLLAVDQPGLQRQAVRSCRGSILRREVFGLDAPAAGATPEQVRRSRTPFSVAVHGSVVTVLQPPHAGRPAVLSVAERETLTTTYERESADRRVEHRLTLEVDGQGNVLRTAAVQYPRASADLAAPGPVRDAQARPRITYTHTEFTTDAIDDTHYRLRRPGRTSVYEITGIGPAGPWFSAADLWRPGFDVLTASTEIPHHDRPPAPAGPGRRLLSRQEWTFYDDAVAGPRPLFGLNARALPYESYQLALTPAVLDDVFAERWSAGLLTEAGYVQRGGAWWVPSGRWLHRRGGESVADAEDRWFAHVAHLDARGARTDITYLDRDLLVATRTVDAAQNSTRVTDVDLRTLRPLRMVDRNGNAVRVACDELGLVRATAIEGKGDVDSLDGLPGLGTDAARIEAAQIDAFLAATASDQVVALAAGLLGSASARQVYDLDRYRRSGGDQPPFVATIVRERHADPDSPVQVTYEYSNGAGQVEMVKAPAEPGPARRVRVLADGSVAVDEVDTAATVPPQLRWIGTGRRVLNSQGRPVKEYEPFFSVSPAFETARELVESGVTKVLSYDALGRPRRVDFPDGTFTETASSPWRIEEADRNDTVLRSAWYSRRVNRQIDAELLAEGRDPAREADAAARAAAHAQTPRIQHLAPGARPIADSVHLGPDPVTGDPILLTTVSDVDVEGRTRVVTDPRGVATMTYEHDLRGTLIGYAGPDGGRRRMLNDVTGEPVRLWDDRGHTVQFRYDDPLHRVTSKRVLGGDGPVPLDHVFERVVYGEGRASDQANNLRGQVALRYDPAGRSENVRFDQQGNLAERRRRFATDYRTTPDWSGGDPDRQLDAEAFTTIEAHDALNRITARTTPDGSVHAPTYNPGNLLSALRITRGGFTEEVITQLSYDARGLRDRLVAGNGVTTTYRYDRQTFRLIRLTTARGNGQVLQDLASTFDPVGNLTHLVDTAVPTVWRSNQVVTGTSTYRFDPAYRLIEATGREHAGQVDFGTADNWTDAGMIVRHDPNDPLDWRTYTQTYGYDPAGNIKRLKHDAGAAATWIRTYEYDPDANRLQRTRIGATAFEIGYRPAHGLIDSMPHLSLMTWGFRDELRATATQRVLTGTPETTWYVYDGDGKRVRKVVDAAAAAGAEPAIRYQRYSLEGVDLRRDHDPSGAVITEHRTVQVLDDTGLVALVETGTTTGGGAAIPLVRYQAINHLGSSSLETDAAAAVISYEEFHPFGTTAYQAVDRSIAAAAKRFRYTGMERDEESGLEYHEARYYVPWLGRWLSPDLHADQLDGNRYAYVRNNPVVNRDRNGKYEEPVHGAATYRLALAAGFSEEDAGQIAIATAGMDHDPKTQPGENIWAMQAQIWRGNTSEYHFPTREKALGDVRGDIAAGLPSLEQFGRHLHSLEDVGFADAPGPHMRSESRLLSQATFAAGVAAIAAGYGLIKGAQALAATGTPLGVAAAVLVGILAGAALLLGAYLVVFSARAAGQGHPWYLTERDGISHSFSHIADEAFHDPNRNKAVLTRVYRELVAARIARYGNPDVAGDTAAANAAIDEITQADTPEKLNKFINDRPSDLHGTEVRSYGEQIEFWGPGGLNWSCWGLSEIDMTINDAKIRHTPQPVPIR